MATSGDLCLVHRDAPALRAWVGRVECLRSPALADQATSGREGGGADQRELTHARHFSCLEGLVDQLEATDPIKKPAPSAITTAMTSGFGVATYATARR
jgi:hypothetical protein